MKIIIAGSGVIGVTSAYYLAKQGHEVVVLDRQSGPALETSYGNAGMVSTGYSAPWAAPGIPMKAIKWLASEYPPLVMGNPFDYQLVRWSMQMLANCTASRYEINKGRLLRLASYSRKAFSELREEIAIPYDEGSKGTLQLFRNQAQLEAVDADRSILEDYGIDSACLDVDQCIEVEPALARVKEKIIGGLRIPIDETGDCFKFTNVLAAKAEALGVTFHFGVDIKALKEEGGRIHAVETSAGIFSADAYVMAMGSYSPLLLRPLGIDLPIYPVKGYSLTLPVTNPEAAPISTLMDETYKVAITRLGDRIRVGGTAELNGYDLTLPKQRRKTIDYVVSDLFPEGGDLDHAEFWTGLRPMTPDGTPVVGETPYENLFLNTGHGTLGWTLSCGSGRLLADVVSGREPEISLEGLTAQRYGVGRQCCSDMGDDSKILVQG